MRDDIEQIVDQPVRCSTCRSITSLLSGPRAPQPQDVQRGHDRRERIAQLVAEHGQELVLGATGLRRLEGEPLEPLPRQHLLGHVVAQSDDAVDAAVLPAHGRVDEGEITVLHPAPALQAQELLSTDMRYARPQHVAQQLVEALTASLGQRLEQRLADHRAPAHHLDVRRVGGIKHQIVAPEHGDWHRRLLEEVRDCGTLVRQALAQARQLEPSRRRERRARAPRTA